MGYRRHRPPWHKGWSPLPPDVLAEMRAEFRSLDLHSSAARRLRNLRLENAWNRWARRRLGRLPWDDECRLMASVRAAEDWARRAGR
jgi:hypothetical protein